MRRLPLGIQTFAIIREEGYLYVDKTERVHQLVSGGGRVFFLSRPRRFGKSLLCSTLGALFSGRRDLFGALAGSPPLAIDALPWEWKQHPVIRIDLNAGNYSDGMIALNSQVSSELRREAEKHALALEDFCREDETIATQFKRLIEKMAAQSAEKVVVIIDEYDKPLLNTIDIPDVHQEMRSALKGFYSVLKGSDEYLRFVFLTGVTKFAQVSVFSDLNHLSDITLNPKYCDICGITQDELEREFAEEIRQVVEGRGREKASYLDKLKSFYNGYRFSENPLRVYNPFGLLHHFFNEGKFSSYWYETGSPSFLIKLIENQRIDVLNLENKTVRYDEFKKYDAENMAAVPVLYQSGYLTIVDYDEEEESYTLDYPNDEVRTSFAYSLLKQYIHASADEATALLIALPAALKKGDIEGAMQSLSSFFASIPYDLIIEKEKYYQLVIHLVFRIIGTNCRSEVRIAAGRIDTLVENKNYVHCFEFKLEGTAEEALKQIDSKEYLLPWKSSCKKLFKIGVNFDREKHNIGEWKVCEDCR